MNNCLVIPVDDSHRSIDALKAGQTLATQMGLALHLLSIVPDQNEVAAREQAIRKTIDGVQAEVSVLVDPEPGAALVRTLSSGKGNVCCMATHARGAVSEMVLGSIARSVVQGYPGPVVLVGPKHAAKWVAPVKTVVICVDGSELSEQALAPAAKCATWLKATLQLVQVLNPKTPVPDDNDSGEWNYLRGLADRVRKEHGIAADWEVLHGKDAATSVTAYVNTQPGSLIVLSSHGRSGVDRVLMGSVAQSIVRDSTSPVWIIRSRIKS